MPFFCTVSSSKVSRKRLMASAKRCSNTCQKVLFETHFLQICRLLKHKLFLWKFPGKTKGWYACPKNKATHWNSSIPVQNLHRINPWKPEQISQQVPTNEQTKFPKLLWLQTMLGFPWLVDPHHPHQQLCDPLLGPWLITNCNSPGWFFSRVFFLLLEDILNNHFRGSLSEFIYEGIPQVVQDGISEPSTRISVFFQFWVTSLCWICCRYWTFLGRWTGWGKKWIAWEKNWQKFSLRW